MRHFHTAAARTRVNLALGLGLLGTAGGIPLASAAEATPDAALAPAEQSASRREFLEEVVVTAQKREERLQDVPLAVTALSGDQLIARGVNDVASLASMTPSLTYAHGTNSANMNFRVRGIGTAVFGDGLEPSVSVVVDGIVLARSAQAFTDLADIERVEVLRGPQGTLFGKNSVGGLINVVTKRPSSTFEAVADATIAEGNEYRVRGSMSGPLSDTLAARLTGYYNDVGGHIYNLAQGQDVNGSKSMGFRGKLQWDPTDALDLLLMAEYRDTDTNCCYSTWTSAVNPLLQQLLAPMVVDENNRQDVENASTYHKTRQTMLSLEANLDLGAVTLTSLTAYQDFWFESNNAFDRLNAPVPVYLPVTNGSADINGGPTDLTQLTQELRVTSPGTGAFNYVAGLYFLDQDVNSGFARRTGVCAPGGAPAAFGLPCIVSQFRSQTGFYASQETRSISAFGQADFALVGKLSGLAGARVQYEELSYDGSRDSTRVVPGDLPLAGFAPSSGSGGSNDTAVTGKLGLKYAFSDDAQTYLTWTSGYKSGAYGIEFAAIFENLEKIEPETAQAWELGYKAQLLGGLLTLNTAVFHAEYEDLQVQANRGNPDIGLIRFITTNAGAATTEGVEVEIAAQPVVGLTLSGGVTYLSTSVDIDGLQCPLSARTAAPVVSASVAPFNLCYRSAPGIEPIQDVRGGDLPNAPAWRGNLTARYDFDVPGTQLGAFLQISGNSQSKVGFGIEQDPLTAQDGYTTVDASFGFSGRDDRYRLTFFVKNLFDKHYLSLVSRASTLTTATVTPDNLVSQVPKEADRYFGATLRVSF